MDEAAIDRLQHEIAALENLVAGKKRQLEAAQAPCIQTAFSPDSGRNELSCAGNVQQDLFDLARDIPAVNNRSSPEAKIALFRSLFKGREDLYARRFESKKTGKSGYQPVCRNEWVRGVCEKPKTSCGSCFHRAFEPLTDEVIRNHLAGCIPAKNEWSSPAPFVIGVYPLLQNETCWFLAMDLDKRAWQEDAKVFMDTCRLEKIPAALERSRSGNGAHVWIFFKQPISAAKARKLGSYLMTRTLDRRPEIGLDSFDRFFPNQDTLPQGGFGNLIALPLQKTAREKNHSVFLDNSLSPYPDQWAFLDSITRLDENTLDGIIQTAAARNELLPVAFDPAGAEDEKPWQRKTEALPVITEPLPQTVEVVVADQIYINHTGLPPVLRNRILRLACFSNPEFYQAQKMRLPTWNKPRILCCYEYFPEYIALPVGCLDGLKEILRFYRITSKIEDKQNHGTPAAFEFHGELRGDQQEVVEKLLPRAAGILSASTAFGKTIAALWIMAQRKTNTLILVHRKQLLDQWVERINQFLGIPKSEIGCFSGSRKKRTGVIDIAVMQSIVRKDAVVDWIQEYGQIIVDECHHIPASSFERIIRKCPAYYRLGLSATVVRKDGRHPIVFMNLGDLLFSHTQHRDDVLFSQKVFPRITGFSIPETSAGTAPAIQDIFQRLCTDENRNLFIAEDIAAAYTEGRECLVLSERLEHLDLLHKALKEKAHLFMLKGGMGNKQVKSIMEKIQAVPADENRISLATGKYLGEGFALPCLDTLFLVFPFSWKGTLIQYTGRLNRTWYGKKEIRVYDYVDDKVPVLFRMYGRRLKGYRSLGFAVSPNE
jgi:superfamily II DNA or RNA helicase